MIRSAAPFFLICLLAGCGSTPPSRFYTLQSLPQAYEAEEGGAVVGVGPLGFPEYLRRPQIVVRGAGPELQLAEFDRWAEPLDVAFGRTLTANIDSLLDDVVVIEYPFGGGRVQADYRILAQVTRFDVDAAGLAELDVRWGVSTRAGDELVPPRRSQYRARSGSSSDYGALVTALNDALEAFSRDIAAAFRAARAASE